ncbi:MAG: pseudouridine synthase [Candidatus Faecousia sp.]|nr:rRNA pseudouridine synthase [Clostridiales bacterium]MDD6297538.1 pseudouridine synthase [Bacillota bacterium]MDD7340613.1 pseudouridine synthase [Bacillota bacterium]MDY2810084.1 pseudouridine synthase [Candidatus Faecousia sp.]
MERLDKTLANAGVGTRSAVKALLKAGRVQVNGLVEKDGSRHIDPAKDTLALDGEPIGKPARQVWMLNKPAGCVTATEDPGPTVMGYLPPALRTSLRPVGRLDKDTEGLLLFTDDGDLLHRLISPKKQVPKVYFARHEGDATEDDVAAFAAGLVLKDGTVCLSAKLEPLGHGESLVTVCEGKYHQVRRMLASRGHFVTYLERRSEGPLSLGDLPRGQARALTESEIQALDGQNPV